MQIQFFIPLRKIPTVTQQEHRISTTGGKKRIHDTAELRTVRQLFRDHLARHRPEAPLEGPVELYVLPGHEDAPRRHLEDHQTRHRQSDQAGEGRNDPPGLLARRRPGLHGAERQVL